MAAGVSAAQSVMVLEERGRQTKDTCSDILIDDRETSMGIIM